MSISDLSCNVIIWTWILKIQISDIQPKFLLPKFRYKPSHIIYIMPAQETKLSWNVIISKILSKPIGLDKILQSHWFCFIENMCGREHDRAVRLNRWGVCIYMRKSLFRFAEQWFIIQIRSIRKMVIPVLQTRHLGFLVSLWSQNW